MLKLYYNLKTKEKNMIADSITNRALYEGAWSVMKKAFDFIEKAKAELLKKNGGKYLCPLPDYVEPPIGKY